MATGGRLPVEARRQQVINLGIPECYAHVRDQIFAILAEYADRATSSGTTTATSSTPARSRSGRAGVHAQTLAFYRLVDEIKAAHPGLEIESCSSGGVARRPRRARAHRPRLGVGLHRPARAAADAPLDDPADAAGADGRAHRLRRTRTPRAATTTCGSGPRRRSGATSASSGTSTAATETELAELAALDRLLQGAPRAAAARRPRPHRLPRRRPCSPAASSPTTGAARSTPSPRCRAPTSPSSAPSPLPGLDPDLRYRVTPVHARPAAGRARPARAGGTRASRAPRTTRWPSTSARSGSCRRSAVRSC